MCSGDLYPKMNPNQDRAVRVRELPGASRFLVAADMYYRRWPSNHRPDPCRKTKMSAVGADSATRGESGCHLLDEKYWAKSFLDCWIRDAWSTSDTWLRPHRRTRGTSAWRHRLVGVFWHRGKPLVQCFSPQNISSAHKPSLVHSNRCSQGGQVSLKKIEDGDQDLGKSQR